MQDLNYSVLQPMDYVNVTDMSPFAIATRIKTAGLSKMFDLSIPTHSGLIVNLINAHGEPRYFIAEMIFGKGKDGRGLRINPLKSYCDNGKFGSRITSIRRNAIYSNTLLQLAANDRVIDDYQKCVDYDLPGVIEYLWPRVKDRPNDYYCSELLQHYALLDGGRIAYKGATTDDDITPVGIQNALNLLAVKDYYLQRVTV